MTAFPSRATLAGTPDKATAQSWLLQQFDAVVGLVGLDGAVSTARSLMAVDKPKIDPSVGSNALTLTLKTAAGNTPSATEPLTQRFRSATLSSGSWSFGTATAAVSLVVSSGSTLNTLSGVDAWLYVYALNNAGAIELAITATNYGQSFIGSTTAEGGAGGADSGTLIYSTTARANVALEYIGRIRVNEATAGLWASAPVEIRGDDAATMPYLFPEYFKVGSWTPSLQFGGASVGMGYTHQVGLYARIDKLVKYWARIALSAKGSSTGNATIDGMPYRAATAAGSASIEQAIQGQFSNMVAPTAGDVYVLRGTNGSTVLDVATYTINGTGGAPVTTTHAAFNNTSIIHAAWDVYTVDAI